VADGARLNEDLIKALTGSDRMVASFLYQEEFEYDPTFKIMLVSNHRPIIRGADHAMWRRIRLVPFDVIVSPERRDPNLSEALQAEVPGVLNWALEGFRSWQACGLAAPQEVEAATNEYREDQDQLADFLANHCELGDQFRATASALYAKYLESLRATGQEPLSHKTFGVLLTERGIRRRKSGNDVLRIGIRLREGGDGIMRDNGSQNCFDRLVERSLERIRPNRPEGPPFLETIESEVNGRHDPSGL
jgi:putative DNA primase/helicase